MIKEQAPPQVETVTTTTTTPAPKPAKATKPEPEKAAPQPAPAASEPSGDPPDVVGLTLPEAKKELSAAGFKANVSNTDTLLGIVVPRNYTICKEQAAHGTVVPILAQKYGC